MKANIKLETSVSTRMELIQKYVSLYSAVGIPEEDWLTLKEKQFFSYCVILLQEGISLVSKEGVALTEKELGFDKKNRGVYIYRYKLKEKGWLIQTEEDLTVPEAFKLIKGIPDILSFNIDLKIK